MSDGWQVYKFGGSSLGTSGRLPRVLDLVAAAPRPLALVVSALGDTTDWLILAARSAEEGNISQARRELAQVRELATATARAVLSSQGQKGVKHDLDEILTPVERLLSGIELTRECSPRTLDSVISVGERISVALLARALTERNVPATAPMKAYCSATTRLMRRNSPSCDGVNPNRVMPSAMNVIRTAMAAMIARRTPRRSRSG